MAKCKFCGAEVVVGETCKYCGSKAERDLLDKLDALDKAGVKFGLSNVFESKGKENTILKEWAKGYTVHYLDHTYSNCSYHKKDKQSKDIEVFITNY